MPKQYPRELRDRRAGQGRVRLGTGRQPPPARPSKTVEPSMSVNTTALKFPRLWSLVSDFLMLVTVWRRICHGGVTGCSGP